jgi:hypothetical protein
MCMINAGTRLRTKKHPGCSPSPAYYENLHCRGAVWGETIPVTRGKGDRHCDWIWFHQGLVIQALMIGFCGGFVTIKN